MRFPVSAISRWLTVLSTLGLNAIASLACQPARLDVGVDKTQAAVAGKSLRFAVKLKDESGGYCAAGRDYAVHLEATNANGKTVLTSSSSIAIPRGSTDASGDNFIQAPAAGLITIRATAAGLRPGLASVFIRPSPAVRERRSAAEWPLPMGLQPVAFVPAAFVKTASSVDVIAHCADGGQVSANGIDSIVVHADLENGPLPYPVKLQFAAGRIEWDGVIAIPAGASSAGVEIHSHRTGPVMLDTLLSSDPSAILLDPAGAQSCKGFEFISPAQYADLEFQANQISYGEPVQLSVVFRDRGYNAIPIENTSQASVQVVSGRQPSFTPPNLEKNGAVTLICKPNFWGRYQFQLLDGSLQTVFRTPDGHWTQGATALSVTFPWIPLCFCLLFGSLGASLHALYQHKFEADWLAPRIALGIGAAILLVTLMLQASLLKTGFQPYTLLILALSLAGGWSGPAAFNWYVGKLGIGVDSSGAPVNDKVRGAASGHPASGQKT